MSYLYHFVPNGMIGTILYPMNILKDVYPELYQKQVKKYEGREELLGKQILPLDCLWNDVLHFVALHPKEVFVQWEKLGLKLGHFACYQIEPHQLDSSKAIVYKPSGKKEHVSEKNSALYDPNTLEQYSYLPDATIEYYRETITRGQKPLSYKFVPHILYKGTLDISDAKIIEI